MPMAAAEHDAGRKAENKRLMMIIMVPAAVVVVCALATSTRANEYKAFSGFVTAEHERMGLRAIMPAAARGHTLPILRDSSLPTGGGKQLDDVPENKPLTPGQVDDKAKEWAEKHPDETRTLFL